MRKAIEKYGVKAYCVGSTILAMSAPMIARADTDPLTDILAAASPTALVAGSVVLLLALVAFKLGTTGTGVIMNVIGKFRGAAR